MHRMQQAGDPPSRKELTSLAHCRKRVTSKRGSNCFFSIKSESSGRTPLQAKTFCNCFYGKLGTVFPPSETQAWPGQYGWNLQGKFPWLECLNQSLLCFSGGSAEQKHSLQKWFWPTSKFWQLRDECSQILMLVSSEMVSDMDATSINSKAKQEKWMYLLGLWRMGHGCCSLAEQVRDFALFLPIHVQTYRRHSLN